MKEIIKKYISIVFIILFFIARILPNGFIPDYLNLSALKNPSELFALILSSTASIIGIVIAVVLLTFDLSKGGFIRRKEDNILNNKTLIYLISLFTVIVILSLVSFVQIKTFDQDNDLTSGYYLIILFTLFISSLFPSIKVILEITNSLKRTLIEVQSITIENINEVLNLQFDNFSFNDNSKLLIRIRQQLIIYIREHDYEAYTNTLQALNKKMCEIINRGEDRRRTDNIVDAICFLWESANNEALRVQNVQYFNTVWECIEQLYEYAAINKINLMYFQQLDFYVSDYSSFLKRNQLNESLFKGVDVLTNSFKLNLKHNCPQQGMLTDLYSEYENNEQMTHHVDESIQWSHIIGFPMDIYSIQNSSIELTDRELFDKCNFELKHLFHDIINQQFENLGIYQEAALIEQMFRIRIENEAKALKLKSFEIGLSSFDLESSYIADLADNEKMYAPRVMIIFSDFIIKLQYEENLSSQILNFWAAIASPLSTKYSKNKLCSRSFDYVLDTMIFLKSFIEENQLPSSNLIYKEIQNQIQSLRNYIYRDHPKSRLAVKGRINKALKTFKPVSKQATHEIIQW